jgi:hypothetical protein
MRGECGLCSRGSGGDEALRLEVQSLLVNCDANAYRSGSKVSVGRPQTACLNRPTKLSQDTIWFQLALFWSTIFKSLILNG